MRQLIFTAAITLFTAVLAIGQVNLKYNWKAGETYRFKATQEDDITMSAMGMKMNDVFNTATSFALQVNNVKSNGVAEGILYVETFKVTDKSGNTVGSLADIPNEALKSLVEVDAKGKFTFKTIVYMLANGNENVLVSAQVKEGQVSGQAQVGDQKLSVHAKFDPKSGTVKAGYSMETVKKPEPKVVKVKKDAKRIDILPLQFLDLLVLPEGQIMPNEEYRIKMMEYVFTTKASSITDVAVIDLNIATDRSKGSSSDMSKVNTEMSGGGMDMEMNMDMGDMDMGDMGDMGGMDMGGMNMAGGAPKMDLAGDISYNFDVKKGLFNKLEGTITNTTKGMGLDLKAVSKLKLVLVK